MKKKLLALLLVLVLSAGFLVACTPENPGNTDTSSNSVLASSDADSGKTDAVASQTDTDEKTSTEEVGDTTDLGEIPEFEKIYQPQDLSSKDYFEDNLILVGIMPHLYQKEYTVRDFADIGCVEISQTVVGRYVDPDSGKQYPQTKLTLVLDQHSKDNVISALRILEAREDVMFAEPTPYYYPQSTSKIPKFEKKYTADNISLDGNYHDNMVIVSFMPGIYARDKTPEDFSEVGCIEIRSVIDGKIVHPETGEKYPQMILCLVLDKNSKENVINAIRILEKDPQIMYAEPSGKIDFDV